MNLAACVLLLMGAQAGPQDQTVRYRELGDILSDIGGRIATKSPKGTPAIVWVVDNSEAFKARHAAILAEALPRLFPKGAASHSVVAFAQPPRVIGKGTDDPAEAAAALTALAGEPADASVKNCLATLREALRLAGGQAS